MPTDDVERYLDALTTAAHDVLGTDLVGAYAAGSLALGAFDPARSDIDVALVCRDPLDTLTKGSLIARLRHNALPCPARGLELVVYALAVAQSGTAEPGFELELNDGPSMGFRQTLDPADRPPADGTFWYGLDRSILHQSGRALSGPPAAETFADLAPDDLRQLLIESLRWWMTLPRDSGADDAVLGACRALVRHRYGVWLSKIDAAHRLLEADFEQGSTIEQAIAARSDRRRALDAQATRCLQNQVLEEIAGRTTDRRRAEGSG